MSARQRRLDRSFIATTATPSPLVSRTSRQRRAAITLGLLVALLGLCFSAAPTYAADMALPGSFDVSPGGSASYTIPIEMPPGTAGVVPALTLQYDSSSPNGIVGPGWSIGGLSSITRCPRTLAQDGVRGGVNYDMNDRFCLNGQRLMVITGTYGADASEYRTEIDSYAKVISHGTAGNGPAWFEVHTKSGQIMEFGNTTTSAGSQILLTGKPTARAWLIDKVSDTKGNYFTVTYHAEPAYGMAYPARIDYTGNGSVQPYNSVRFSYTERGDRIRSYEGGTLIYSHLLVTNIQTYNGSSLISDYQLGWQSGEGNAPPTNKLVSVTRCGADSTCLPATMFRWTSASINDQNGAFGFSAAIGSTGGWNFSTPVAEWYTPIVGDFNGDGKTDYLLLYQDQLYVFLSNGNGSFTQSYIADGAWFFGSPPNANFTPVVGDFNADGLTDFVLLGQNVQYCFLSKGDGTFALVGGSNGWYFGYPPDAQFTPIVGDFNGDGRTDYMFIQNNIQYVMFSNGDGTFTGAGTFNASGWGFGAPPTAQFTPITGDFNGDGKTDFVMLYDNQQYCMLSNGDGTFTTVYGSNDWHFGSPPSTSFTPIVGDFNGDGKTDYMFTQQNVQYVMLSQGDGTFTGIGSTNGGWYFGSPPAANFTPIVGDFNGDGKTDYLFLQDNVQYLLLSNGDGTFYSIGSDNPWGSDLGAPVTESWLPIVGDFDGDGKADFVLLQQNMQYVFLTGKTLGAGGGNIYQKPYSRVASITSGLGATINITYAPLTSSAAYTKSSGDTYPLQDVQPAMYVVQQVSVGNGVGGSYNVAYSYSGGVVDLSGRGFLGFASVLATDQQTSIVQGTSYQQQFPFTGLANQRNKYLPTPLQYLTQAANIYQFSNNSGAANVSTPSSTSAPYQVLLSESIASGFDLDGTALPTVTTSYQYDAYGNATQVARSTPDGASNTATHSYSNDIVNWILGRLTGATVTSTVP